MRGRGRSVGDVQLLSGVRRVQWTLPVLDAGISGVLIVAAVGQTAEIPGLSHPWTEVVAAALAGSTALRTRAPFAMCAIAAAGAVAFASMPGTTSPLWLFLALLVVGFSAAANLAGGYRVAGLLILLGSAYYFQIVTTSRVPAGEYSWSDLYISPLVIVLAPAVAGWLLQRSRHQTAETQRLAAELSIARDREAETATLAERSRIARELHDVISHAVSVMVVQAGAAEQLMPPGSPAHDQVRAVRETGKQAMAELRRQLGLMRVEGPSSSSPLPGLAEVSDLAESSGAELSLELAGGELPPGLELTAYRIVQEALTNARRHAPGAPVCVRLGERDAALDIVVEDSGGGGSIEEGSGSGLRGMRERVELYGGYLVAGPRADATGWRVHARLPLPANPLARDAAVT